MTRFTRVCITVYLTVLGIWTGSLMMTAGAAAVTFPTIKTLDPIVPSLDETSRPHWQFIGGKVVANVFLISHFVQAVCALLAVVALVGLCRSVATGRRMRRSVSMYATGLGIGVLALYLLVLWPRMRENLHTYWDNLNSGKIEAARVAQQAFDSDHPLASRTLQVLLLLVFTAFVSGAWNTTPSPERKP